MDRRTWHPNSRYVDCVYGIVMTPLGGKWQCLCGDALGWFLVNERGKPLAYSILDPTRAQLLLWEEADLSPQIAIQAYELYQARLRGEGQPDQDWLEVESEDTLKTACGVLAFAWQSAYRGADVHYWEPIAKHYGLNLQVMNETVDPTFSFMALDRVWKIRMG